MPTCKKCNTPFPNKILIEGKERRFNNRSYCLECSPFGLHSTQKHAQSHRKLEPKEISCASCNRIYFYDGQNRTGHTLTACNSCCVNNRRFSVMEKCYEYLGGKCKVCGYNKSKRALSFHHRNPLEKLFSISGNTCRKWDVIKKELDKCDLMCANCHLELHEQESIESKNNKVATAGPAPALS
jgi:hypothetical protein